MNGENTTRRRFLIATIAGSSAIASGLGLSLIHASSAWAQATPGQTTDSTRTLAQMARVLYPHSALPDSVYAEVVGGILSTTAADAQMIALLEQAVTELGEARDTDFFDLDEESQLEVITALQKRPFFEAVKFQVLAHLYSHPQVWKLINYPGSSVEHGGYVERGFNDIDWLPEDAS
jgi:hypothetical protein